LRPFRPRRPGRESRTGRASRRRSVAGAHYNHARVARSSGAQRVNVLRPLPRRVTRPIALLVVVSWVATMVLLVARVSGQAAAGNLAADLARYGSSAVWRGIYYRGEKIGFTVDQTIPNDAGFELQEDGRLQMSLLGSTSAVRIRTSATV